MSVIKNTIKKQQQPVSINGTGNTPGGQVAKTSNENERKSIMNNNLAETLKSIGIIGSLKPTSNNSQMKSLQHTMTIINNDTSKTKENTQTTIDTNKKTAVGGVELTAENQLISKFNRRFRQQKAEFKQQYEKIEQKFKQILSNEKRQ